VFLLSGPEKLLAVTFLVTTLLSVGLRTGVAEVRALLASRALLTRMLLANFVVVPLLGFAIARSFALPPPTTGALLLLACIPGGLSAMQFTSKVKGEEALAGAMLVVLNLLALAVSPLIVRLAEPAGVDLALPYGLLAFLAPWVLVPLGAGIATRELWPQTAAALAKVTGIVGVLAFVVFMTVTKSARKEALQSVGGPAVLAMALLIAGSMLAGWVLGGPTRESRQVSANATSMRNAALCLAMARGAQTGDAVTPLVAFSLLMVPPNMLLMLAGSILTKRAARRTAEAAKAS
jgi:predicted Na+-dependent transporter